MIATICLFGFMLTAAVTDLWRHKIYNWTTYAGTCAAFVLSGLAGALERDGVASVGLGQSLSGFLVCGSVMLVCFVFFRVGGGDVKLLAMAGAFLGPEFGIEALLWTFVLGGATGVIVLIWKLGAARLAKRVAQQVLWKLKLGAWQPLNDEERQQMQMPLFLAPNALAAVLLVHLSVLDRFM